MEKLNYDLKFSEKVQGVISNLVEKYHMELDENLSLSERLKKKDPEVVIFKAAKIIIEMPRGKNLHDVVLFLKDNLQISQEIALNLAHDIKNEVIPLVDIIPVEEEIQETPKLKTEAKPDKDRIIPFIKKVETRNVEENAKKMVDNMTEKKEEIMDDGEADRVKTVIPQEQEKKGTDEYRESLN